MEIGYKQAVDLVTAAVSEAGEHTRRSCVYAVEDQAHCIVGVALSLAGVPVEALALMSGPIDDPNVLPSGVTLTPRAARFLRAAQYTQDGGRTWGEALRRARNLDAIHSQGGED